MIPLKFAYVLKKVRNDRNIRNDRNDRNGWNDRNDRNIRNDGNDRNGEMTSSILVYLLTSLLLTEVSHLLMLNNEH